MWGLLAELGSLLWERGMRKAMLGGALGGLTPFLIFYSIGKYVLPPSWAESGDIAILLMATCLPAALIGAISGSLLGWILGALSSSSAEEIEKNWWGIIGYIGGLFPWILFALFFDVI